MRPREVSRISCCVAGDPFSLHILQRRHPRCLFERRKELIHRNVDYDEIEFLPHHMRIVVDTGLDADAQELVRDVAGDLCRSTDAVEIVDTNQPVLLETGPNSLLPEDLEGESG